jgi:RpiR family transcriptional regulator, carbohydrate utilization regulator
MSYLENTIQASYPTLTKKEGRIADYLLNHTDEAKSKTISEIAEICEVAESTVFLFSKKIGLSGFKELTVLLSNSSKKMFLKESTKKTAFKPLQKK